MDQGNTAPQSAGEITTAAAAGAGESSTATAGSVWAIGDVHGQREMLETLFTLLPRAPHDTTVFLGDYIDRGPDSAGVVRRALAEYDQAPERTILLWGNHEDMAAAYFGFVAPSGYQYDPFDWFRNGGIAALESFGHRRPELFRAPCPPEFERLFGLLRPFWRAPAQSGSPALSPYIWVHAGVPPGLRPEDAPPHHLVWIRDEFLNVDDPSGRIVIHGHTPLRDVRLRADKIGIDTGAVYGGALTALELPARRVFQAGSDGRVASFDLDTTPVAALPT
jgi:serine/threonine protein phosphatase 1